MNLFSLLNTIELKGTVDSTRSAPVSINEVLLHVY